MIMLMINGNKKNCRTNKKCERSERWKIPRKKCSKAAFLNNESFWNFLQITGKPMKQYAKLTLKAYLGDLIITVYLFKMFNKLKSSKQNNVSYYSLDIKIRAWST